jgi:hypothetical protein
MFGCLKLLILSCAFLATSFAQAQVNASSFEARVKLIQYEVQFEAKHSVDLSVKKKFSWIGSLIQNAEAYANGEACLVLGFKSTFEDNLCKLSAAEGATDYQSQCTSGTLPCNPTVFGQADATHVFCAPTSAGSQLSRSCAYQSFQFLDKQSGHAIPNFDQISFKNFDAGKLDLNTGKTALIAASKVLFSAPNASLDRAFDFTAKLCQDISGGKKTGNQPEDLKTCKMYLGFLSQAKTDATPQVASLAVTPSVNRSPAVVNVDSEPSISPVVRALASDECINCSEPTRTQVLAEHSDLQIHTLVNGLQNADGAAQLNACLQALESQPEIPSGKKGVYWKQINGQKTFAMQCGRGSDTSTSLKFAFMTDQGYQQVAFPRVTYTTSVVVNGVTSVEHPQVPDQLVSFKANGTSFYANIKFSDSFDLVSEPDLATRAESTIGMSAAKARSRAAFYKAKLTDHQLSSDFKMTPADPGNANDAWVKSCVQDRAVDFLTNLLSHEYNSIAPTDSRIRADWNLATNSPEFRTRYAPSLSDWSETLRTKVMLKVPACASVIDSALFYKAFDRSFLGDPAVTQNYNSLHHRIAH